MFNSDGKDNGTARVTAPASGQDRIFYILNAITTILAMSFLIWLLYFRNSQAEAGAAVAMLPAVNAGLNACSAIILCFGYLAIRKRQEALHRTLMLSAFVLSALFLICYVIYHTVHGDTRFLGQGWIRPAYFFVLVSHILLSMLVFPMILSSIFFGLTGRRKLHRKIAKITLPAWLYVSVTGVFLFFLLKYHS